MPCADARLLCGGARRLQHGAEWCWPCRRVDQGQVPFRVLALSLQRERERPAVDREPPSDPAPTPLLGIGFGRIRIGSACRPTRAGGGFHYRLHMHCYACAPWEIQPLLPGLGPSSYPSPLGSVHDALLRPVSTPVVVSQPRVGWHSTRTRCLSIGQRRSLPPRRAVRGDY
ncbi:hypothetical protein GQ53DRAFT_415465 [Thozetella sp. PMI_491]|nr:hypothetical protein GQ53DRAFT_415465 [Thozetella sp. PMI_491]